MYGSSTMQMRWCPILQSLVDTGRCMACKLAEYCVFGRAPKTKCPKCGYEW
jgi:hypothetical protein